MTGSSSSRRGNRRPLSGGALRHRGLPTAEVEDVILCELLGRAIVLVREDQLSLAIGRRGQNVRLGSKLSGWDIEIMTQEELGEQIDRAVEGFSVLEGISEELAVKLVEQRYMSYDDLSVIEPDVLMEMGGLTEAAVDGIVVQAETKAEEAEKLANEARRKRREQERINAAVAKQAVAEGSGADAETEKETKAPEAAADGATPVEGEKEIVAESEPEETLSGESDDRENSDAVDQVSAQEASAEATEQ